MNYSISELLISFLKIGLISIGGGYATIPLIQEQIVEKQQWLTYQEFTDVITVSQMTPGPLAVNTSTFVGMRIAGIKGAIVATFGCVITGIFISLFLYQFFHKMKKNQSAIAVMDGLKAVSIGLIGASALSIISMALLGISDYNIIEGQINIRALFLFGLIFFLLRKNKRNPILIIILSGILGIVIYL